MNQTCKHIFHLLILLLFYNLSFAQDTTQVVNNWLKKNSFPIETVEPTNTFSDLNPLKSILKDVSVIGLGESTHGTREFFQIKHRLVQFLVIEMGFTAFAIEASNSATQPINDYVISGKGDRATVLTGQGYMGWDTEEFAAMLDWMRTYNQKVPDERKVKFYGIDVRCCHGVAREKVLAYLKEYVPEKVAATDSLFRVLATEDEKWPTRLTKGVLQQTLLPVQDLLSHFTTNKNKLVSISSLAEWEQTFRFLQVMEWWLFANLENVSISLLPLKQTFRESMAKNLFYLMGKEKPNAKFIVWAHNGHIATDTVGAVRVGYYLRQKLGEKYYALALEVNEGTFQTRVLLPDGYWGKLKADTIPPAARKSLPWHLSQVGDKVFINLREVSPDPIILKWLETPIETGMGVYVYRGRNLNRITIPSKRRYDGILYIELSTPVHPTKNALERSANNIGF